MPSKKQRRSAGGGDFYDFNRSDETEDGAVKQKRRSHSVVERNRRDRMKSSLSMLTNALPTVGKERIDKLTLLRSARLYISDLQRKPIKEDGNPGMFLMPAMLSEGDKMISMEMLMEGFYAVLDCYDNMPFIATRQISRLLGYSTNEFCQQDLRGLVHPDDLAAFELLLSKPPPFSVLLESARNEFTEKPDVGDVLPFIPDESCLRSVNCRLRVVPAVEQRPSGGTVQQAVADTSPEYRQFQIEGFFRARFSAEKECDVSRETFIGIEFVMLAESEEMPNGKKKTTCLPTNGDDDVIICRVDMLHRITFWNEAFNCVFGLGNCFQASTHDKMLRNYAMTEDAGALTETITRAFYSAGGRQSCTVRMREGNGMSSYYNVDCVSFANPFTSQALSVNICMTPERSFGTLPVNVADIPLDAMWSGMSDIQSAPTDRQVNADMGRSSGCGYPPFAPAAAAAAPAAAATPTDPTPHDSMHNSDLELDDYNSLYLLIEGQMRKRDSCPGSSDLSSTNTSCCSLADCGGMLGSGASCAQPLLPGGRDDNEHRRDGYDHDMQVQPLPALQATTYKPRKPQQVQQHKMAWYNPYQPLQAAGGDPMSAGLMLPGLPPTPVQSLSSPRKIPSSASAVPFLMRLQDQHRRLWSGPDPHVPMLAPTGEDAAMQQLWFNDDDEERPPLKPLRNLPR